MSAHIVRQLDNSSLWSEINPSRCPCKGSGWLLSDWDTVHKCQEHARNSPNPYDEDFTYDDNGLVEYDWDKHTKENFRDAYRFFKKSTDLDGRQFKKACIRYNDGEIPSTDARWVDMAELVYGEHQAIKDQEYAEAQGYSCALEMRMEREAYEEEWRRRHGVHDSEW